MDSNMNENEMEINMIFDNNPDFDLSISFSAGSCMTQCSSLSNEIEDQAETH